MFVYISWKWTIPLLTGTTSPNWQYSSNTCTAEALCEGSLVHAEATRVLIIIEICVELAKQKQAKDVYFGVAPSRG